MTEEEKKNVKEIEVSVNMNEVLERIRKSENKAQAFDEMAKKLSKALKNEGVNIDSTDINPHNLETWVHKLSEYRERNKRFALESEEEAKENAEPIGKGGGGQATLDMATGKSRFLEFDSGEEMIDYLRDKAKSGDKEAKAILDELFLKSSKGFLEKGKDRVVFEDKSTEPLSEKLNRAYRKKVLEKRKKEEEI